MNATALCIYTSEFTDLLNERGERVRHARGDTCNT